MLSQELRDDLVLFITSEQPSLLREYIEKMTDLELTSIRDDMIEDAVRAGRL